MKTITVQIRPEQARVLSAKKMEADAAVKAYQGTIDAVFAGLIPEGSTVKGWNMEGACTIEVDEAKGE